MLTKAHISSHADVQLRRDLIGERQEHFQWEIMQNMCDPTGIVEQRSPVRSFSAHMGVAQN